MIIRKHISITLFAVLFIAGFFNAGCGVYKFNDVAIPDTMRTFNVQFIENRAPYVNPQLAPTITDRLKRKISSQTRLRESSAENADYYIKPVITDYSVSTSGVSNKTEVMNRLTIVVHISVTNQKTSTTDEYDVTWNTEYSAQFTLQAAETRLFETIVRSLTDDIFNRLFSKW